MSRPSAVERTERLLRELRHQPVLTVYYAPWLLEMRLGRPPSSAELKLTAEEFDALHPPTRPWERTP